MTFTSLEDPIDEEDAGNETMYAEQLLLDESEAVEGCENADQRVEKESKREDQKEEVGVVDRGAAIQRELKSATTGDEAEGAEVQRHEAEEEEEEVEYATPVTAGAVSHTLHIDGKLIQL